MSVKSIMLDEISRHPHQPRKTYAAEAIKSLAESIQRFGLIQPIVVMDDGGAYRLTAGQRRLKAFQYLRDNVDQKRYEKIPAVVRSRMDEGQQTFVALAENLERENLNIIDKAEAFNDLIERGFAKNHTEIGKAFTISRQVVGQYIQITELPDKVKDQIRESKYSDIKVLCALSSEKEAFLLLENIIKKKMNQRDALSYIKGFATQAAKPEQNLKGMNASPIKGDWGQVENTPKRMKLNLNPQKLTDDELKILDKLIKSLSGRMEK